MSKEIFATAIPVKQLHYKDGFGVYACELEEFVPEIELNKYGNFVINGEMPELVLMQKYKFKLVESTSQKYGKGYRYINSYQEIPTTIEGQHLFLRAILPPSHAEAIISSYPENDVISMIKDGTFNYENVKGIGEKTFEKIKTKISENLEIQEALVELSQYDITYTIIQKIVKHFDISPSLAVQKIKENPYILCEVSGLGFIKVDGYARKMGVAENDPARIRAALEYTLKEEEQDGHTWISFDKALDKIKKLTGVTKDIAVEVIKADEQMFWQDENRVGLMKNRNYEEKITKHIMELLNSKFDYTILNVDEKIKMAEEEVGFNYTDEQKNAVYKVLKHNVVVISGKAGTGKSTLLKLIMRVLGGIPYSSCAFSGKAAQRIQESTGLNARTIHRMLGYTENRSFMYNERNKLPVSIINLDEGSMVPLYLFYHLVSAIEPGSKLIILGDIEQLPPIGAGNVMRDLIDSGIVPVAELTQVHRQALKSGILVAANLIREGKQITEKHEDKARVVGELQDLFLIPKQNGEEIYDYVKKLCESKKNNVDIMEFQIIAPMKSRGVLATKNLNVMLQEIFNPGDKPKIKRHGYEFKVGDKIIQVGNDYNKGVFNGTLGKIVRIDEEERIIEILFVGHDNTLIYELQNMDNVDMAYALTIHKVQGSQFKQVVFALDYAAYPLLSKQLVYTGLTRASEKCVFVFENKALRFAISQNHSGERNTFLKELLVKKAQEGVTNNEYPNPEEYYQKSTIGV